MSERSPYLHVGRASDLTGFDRVLYRFFEMVPGLLAWGTILFAILLSYFAPVWAAIFIILFDLYWLFKTLYLSIHLRHNFKRLKYHLSLPWGDMIARFNTKHLYHLVLLPFYNEDEAIIEKSIVSILSAKTKHKKIFLVLAAEARAGDLAYIKVDRLIKKYEARFGAMIGTFHPKDVPGEMPGKGSNIAYAAEEAVRILINPQHIPYKDVIVSAFDIDTAVYPDYFNCLAWHYMTTPNPVRASYQPVPIYNNNVFDLPAISRVVSFSGTFWQMVQQERPERLATFSSHAVSLEALVEAGYWQRNIVSEDSRIFWNLFIAHRGDYTVVPISYPVSLDGNLAPTFFKTLVNVYKQQRRWGWGVENVAYILFNFVKDRNISWWKKIKYVAVQLEGFWSLATNPILIFLLGWLPLIVGGSEFKTTVLSYNLPLITRNLMILSMCGLIMSSYIAWVLLPHAKKRISMWSKAVQIFQWIFIPFTIVIFGAIPGLEAQTRLMLGKYMGFWVTPKHRK